MPAKFKRNLFLLILTVTAIGGFLIAANKWQGNQQIKEIDIQGNSYVSDTYIRNHIYNYVLSKKPDEIDFGVVRQEILKIPLISDCKIITSYPEKLIFLISCRQVISRACSDYNVMYLFTENGSLINVEELKSNEMLQKNANFEHLPLINFVGSLSKDSSGNRDLVEFIKMYDKLKMGTSIKSIWKNINGICCNLVDNKVVVFGSTQDIEQKFIKFQTFVDKILSKEDLQIKIIDLRWNNQLVVK